MINMEKRTNYEVKKNTSEDFLLEQTFANLNRQFPQFIDGDIVITADNRLQQIGNELSAGHALQLLKSETIKAFFPVESRIIPKH